MGEHTTAEVYRDSVANPEACWMRAVVKNRERIPGDAADPLYILYTSGTSGKPEAVVHDNGGHDGAARDRGRHRHRPADAARNAPTIEDASVLTAITEAVRPGPDGRTTPTPGGHRPLAGELDQPISAMRSSSDV